MLHSSEHCHPQLENESAQKTAQSCLLAVCAEESPLDPVQLDIVHCLCRIYSCNSPGQSSLLSHLVNLNKFIIKLIY